MLDFLKTMPDMTTQEITMIEAPKISISQRIRDYKAANPDASVKEVAKAVGTSLPYAYQVLNQPPKKAKKVTTPKAASANAVSVKEHEAVMKRLDESFAEVMDLEAENLGLRAIIKYLEDKLNGTPV